MTATMTVTMSPSARALIRATLLAGSALAAAPAAHAAEAWPARPITIVVPFAAGGATDILTRVLARQLGDELGVQVPVANQGGAGTRIGTERVARADSDGYTLLFTTSALTVNPTYQKVNYDPLADFTPITQAGVALNVLLVSAQLPVTSTAALVAYARANPGKLTYGSAGNGTAPHLQAALFSKMLGVPMTHAPYQGDGPAMIDLAAGRIQLMFGGYSSSLSYVENKTIRMLGVTAGKRSGIAPDLPAVAEGLPGYELTSWVGLLGPGKLDPAIVNKLDVATRKVLAKPEVVAQYVKLGMEITAMPAREFTAFVRNDVQKWTRLTRELGIKAE